MAAADLDTTAGCPTITATNHHWCYFNDLSSSIPLSFSSDQLRLRVGGLLSNRNVSEGRGEGGRAPLEQLVKRVVQHVDGCLPHAADVATNYQVSPAINQRETIAGRLCDAVGGIMAAPRWSPASMPCSRRGGTLHAGVRRTLTRAS